MAPQEIPPLEGFAQVPYKRQLPRRGPPGWMMFGGLLSLTSFGCELEREKRQCQLQIIPILQAEQDMGYLKALEVTRRLEGMATVDDPTWEVGKSMYHYRKDVAATILLNERGELISI